MEGNILDSIRKAFGGIEELDLKFERKPQDSAFMNRKRQEIFSYLCAHPCSTLTGIASDTNTNIATVKWHLVKLIDKEFLVSAKVGVKTVLYPSGLIDPKHLKVLSCLNETVPKKIFSTVLHSRGISQKELCTALNKKHQTIIYHIAKLRKIGLIISMKDGRYSRYFPSDILSRLRESSMKQANYFRKNFIKLLRKDGVSPRIARTTYSELHVEVMRGAEKVMIVIHTDPFVTVLT